MCGKLVPVDGRFSAASGSGVPHHGGAMSAAAGPAADSATAATSATGSQRRSRRAKCFLPGSAGAFGLLPASLHGLGGPRRVLASSSICALYPDMRSNVKRKRTRMIGVGTRAPGYVGRVRIALASLLAALVAAAATADAGTARRTCPGAIRFSGPPTVVVVLRGVSCAEAKRVARAYG